MTSKLPGALKLLSGRTIPVPVFGSSHIQAIGYNPRRLILGVLFKNGGYYEYGFVPPWVFLNFLASGSKGGYFWQNIRGNYPNI